VMAKTSIKLFGFRLRRVRAVLFENARQ
jgi:hypothetical protein